MHTKFWSESLEGKSHLGDLGVDEINIKMNFKERVCTEFICLRTRREQ
jgi:hypothetical protein